MYKKILVATDGSDLSGQAVDHAVQLARLAGAELYALTVIAPAQVSYWEGTTRYQMQDSSRIDDQNEEIGRKIAQTVKERAAGQGLTAHAITVKSEMIAESIVSAAEKYQCDVIVMASHGRRGINRILLGNETLNVLTQSKIPVLVLR